MQVIDKTVNKHPRARQDLGLYTEICRDVIENDASVHTHEYVLV